MLVMSLLGKLLFPACMHLINKGILIVVLFESLCLNQYGESLSRSPMDGLLCCVW